MVVLPESETWESMQEWLRFFFEDPVLMERTEQAPTAGPEAQGGEQPEQQEQ